MLHTHVIAPHLTRHKAAGKSRRPTGDPVAPVKEYTRFLLYKRSFGRCATPPYVLDDVLITTVSRGFARRDTMSQSSAIRR